MIKTPICRIYIKIVFVIISELICYHHLEIYGCDENLDILTFLIIQISNNFTYYLFTKV